MSGPAGMIAAAVRALVVARTSGRATAALPLPDADSAYAVQQGVADAFGWFAAGEPAFWKSGGPSREAAQTHARLPVDGVWASPADATRRAFHARGIEAELALRLGQDVDGSRAAALGLDGARALVDAMTVSIEVVDSRWQPGAQAPALAKLADLQSHGALVLGDWVPFDAGRDWSAQDCEVRIGSRPACRFRGTHSMRDPACVLPAWLRHATRAGGVVSAGTVVTTGTWFGLLAAQPGDRVQVVFDGIGAALLQF